MYVIRLSLYSFVDKLHAHISCNMKFSFLEMTIVFLKLT
jgi:hypothetical protein